MWQHGKFGVVEYQGVNLSILMRTQADIYSPDLYPALFESTYVCLEL